MRGSEPRLLRHLTGAAAASGLALAGLVMTSAPASAAACSGTSGVTVVVDTGGSVNTRCAAGDPASGLRALTAAGFSVTYPQQYPGSVVCRINGFPASDPCVRMPPADAYWAFFHATRGGGWTYSSSGVSSYDPRPGTVVGFRFGAGQQPRVAPPEPTATSAPAVTTTKPQPTSAPRTTTSAPEVTSAPPSISSGAAATAQAPGVTASVPPSHTATPSRSASASASPSGPATPTATSSATPSTSATPLAAAPTAEPDDGPPGMGTLVAGAALLALVGGGAGWTAWKRRA
ncbi:MAG: hypothetical protein K0R30_1621 [Ornithinibacter sp.]|nr:hypothetical protein [Ornithinibacter sp.]